jgi:hypothetical protein
MVNRSRNEIAAVGIALFVSACTSSFTFPDGGAQGDDADDAPSSTGDDAAGGGADAPGADAPGNVADAGTACSIEHVVFGEVRSRGAGGASDEFIELFNPTPTAVTLDGTWTIQARSASATAFTTRWSGRGNVIPAHGFYLVVGALYGGTPTPDDHLTGGITDATSLHLEQSGQVVDALCYAYGATTIATLESAGYGCAGTPSDNMPHDDTSTAASDVDQSLARKRCANTGNDADDYSKRTPATPKDTTSPPDP